MRKLMAFSKELLQMPGTNLFIIQSTVFIDVIMQRVPLVAFGLLMFIANAGSIINPLDLSRQNCTRTVDKCEFLHSPVCLGTTLPYQLTSSALVPDLSANNLQLWKGLQNIPKCWEVVQALICAVYAPKCQTNNTTNVSTIQLPAKKLCEMTREPCRIVDKNNGWPEFLQCDHPIYVAGCTNDVMTAHFNKTANCEVPLVATTNAKSWHPDIDGCGIQCENPIYTDEEHQQVHMFIAIIGSVCLVCTLIAVVTFVLDWKTMSRYPTVIIFFINACFLIGTIGWMAQFIPGARKDIICRSDGTMRKAEPQIGSGENSTCIIIFIVVYYFLMAGVTWFVILTYTMNLSYGSTVTNTREAVEAKRGHFHMLAWSLPLVLTIVCLAISQIDGDSVSGICFVGFVADSYRGGFVLLPIGIAVVIGLSFLLRGLVRLIQMKTQSPGLINDEGSARLRNTIIRLGIFAMLVLSFMVITLSIHIYIFLNGTNWQTSLDEYIACKSNITSYTQMLSGNPKPCVIKNRPSAVSAQIHVFAYFAAGIIMSSWVWKYETLNAWKRNLRKLFCLEGTAEGEGNASDQQRKLELVPNMFLTQKDLKLRQQSLSNHEDPHAMDLTSVTSRELSSSWAPVQRMMLCRSGLHSGRQRRYSDSDVQSISSLFDHVALHDAQHSKRAQPKSSQDASRNGDSARPNSTANASVTAKPKRHSNRKKNRVVPANDSTTNTCQQLKRTEKVGKGGPPDGGNPIVHLGTSGTDSVGCASSLAGFSSIACGSSFAARSSFSGGSSLMARSSTVGGSSMAGGTSSDAHPETPVSDSDGSKAGDCNGGVQCKDPVREKAQSERTSKHKCLNLEPDDEVFSKSVADEQEDEEEDYDEEDEEDDEKEDGCSNRSPSNFTIASSDTEALSIKLDNDYQPVEPVQSDPPQLKAIPPSTNVIKVSPIKPTIGLNRKQLYNPLSPDIMSVHPNSKPTVPGQTMHNSTQTSSGFLPPFGNLGPHSPFSVFNYGGYMPPIPPMFCIPNSETPIWPPYGYPAYYYPPFLEPRPYFPFPPSYYSQFTPPPAPYETLNQAQFNPGAMGVPAPQGQTVTDEHPPPSRSTSQQTKSSAGASGNPHWIGATLATAFRSPAGDRSRINRYDDQYSKSLLEMVELMTPQLDSGTEPTDSESTPREEEISKERQERRKTKRRERHRWLKTLTVDQSKDCSDTSL